MNPGGLKSFITSRRIALLWVLLAAPTVIAYWQVSAFEFTNYDEFVMILQNPYVLGGLTLKGLSWALTTSWFEYWHPLTWLSHMLDCELFGLNPGWHHLVSLGFHVANTLLLFTVLQRMTGALWRSAMVAALFALHPLHVESVAWIAERKDVLSGFFFFLTLWAYARYTEVQSPKSKVQSPESMAGGQCSVVTPHASRITFYASRIYLLSLLFFACGLMSKPMLVTLPFVLLLLDYWPLRRLRLKTQDPRLKILLIEKLPFFALTVASCVVTYLGAKAGGNVLSAARVPWGLRLANVPVSYVRYLGKMIWPTDLIAMYPMPDHWPGWQVGGAVVVVVLISLFAVLRARSAPYLIVGWLFFLGILVPTIGIVQAGFQSIADRYTYIPAVGIFIAVVWAVTEWAEGKNGVGISPAESSAGASCEDDCRPPHPALLSLGGEEGESSTGQAQVGCLPLPRRGGEGWGEGEIGCTVEKRPSSAMRESLGSRAGGVWVTRDLRPVLLTGAAIVTLLLCGYLTWVQTGYWRNSFALWMHCLAVCPDNVVAHYNLGYVLQHSDRTIAAIEQYRAALRLKPDHLDANLNLGIALMTSNRVPEATNYLAAAMRIKPNYAKAQGAMGLALFELGDYSGAIAHCAEAIRLDPSEFGPYVNMGRALGAQGKSDDALRYYAEALRLNPVVPQTHYYLGLEWMKRRAFDQAAASFGEAARLAPAWAEARAQQQLALQEAGQPRTNTDTH